MDSCNGGEQDESFDSLDAIPSSASSENESGRKDDHQLCKSPAAAMARYEVWQSDSGSIFERRQRLFTQMGLQLEWEDSRTPTDAHSPEKKAGSQDKFETVLSYGVNSSDGLFHPRDNGIASLRESSDNACKAEDSSVLVQTHRQQTDANYAVLKSGSIARSTESGNIVEERELSNQVSSGNHDPSQEFTSIDGENMNCMTCHGRPSLKGSPVVLNDHALELPCRVKDLDSGVEFIVNEVGEDGSWNRLKELHSGRELTLEEFESSLGLSPVVQEVMKRERVSDDIDLPVGIDARNEKKKRAWFKSIIGFVNSSRGKGIYKSDSNGRVTSTEKSGRRSSSESNDSREASLQLAKRVKVHAHKKSTKEFADLYLRQEIQAHQGAIWTMKFNFDGSLLATAGQDKVVLVWEVLDHDNLARSPSSNFGLSCSVVEARGVGGLLQCHNHSKGSAKGPPVRTAALSSNCPFLLSERPKCVFNGHVEDVLDLSWSNSQFLLSSSMDKTVRLWNVMTGECSRVFAHNDYVTCIHFNPVDDGYFISGSLDGKVRVWSIKERQVVDWVDLSEMVTAACYTQNGKGAVVGSYKGTCHFFKTSDSKLEFDTKFDVQRKKKRGSPGKKITGFQFIPGDESKILITSNDSRIRVYDGSNVSSKYKGLQNRNSQTSASISLSGMHIICASEDSRVCIWKYYDSGSYPVQKQKTLSGSYEDFSAQQVSVAIPWPGVGYREKPNYDSSAGLANVKKNVDVPGMFACCEISPYHSLGGVSMQQKSVQPTKLIRALSCPVNNQPSCQDKSSYRLDGASVTSPLLNLFLEDCCSVLSKVRLEQIADRSQTALLEGRGSATWPEENLPSVQNAKCYDGDQGDVCAAGDLVHPKLSAVTAAWGLVIVTAGLEGHIRIFQNQSLPV